MSSEAKLQAGQQLELTDEAITSATEALKTLIVARNPEEPITEPESNSINTWIGVAVAAGFQKGKWLSDVEHARSQGGSFSLDHPSGYPT